MKAESGFDLPNIPLLFANPTGQHHARLSGRCVHPFLQIESSNNFPTAAGLASSASGLAALAFALCKLYKIDHNHSVSAIARRGSGSACRSCLGGFVHWRRVGGQDSQPSSRCIQLYPQSYWPDLKVLICVVNPGVKPIGSSQAMRRTVETSQLFHEARLTTSHANVEALTEAISAKSFPELVATVIRESNQLHALCRDSTPPIDYLTRTSWNIINWVHTINDAKSNSSDGFELPLNPHNIPTLLIEPSQLAYTFDAGPNAFLILRERDIDLVLRLLASCFGSKSAKNLDQSTSDSRETFVVEGLNQTGPRRLSCIGCLDQSRQEYRSTSSPLSQNTITELLDRLPVEEDGIRYVICTEIGDGPQVLSSSGD